MFDSEASKAIAAKMLLQGALVGGSAASVVGLFNLMKRLNDKVETSEPTEDDTFVLQKTKTAGVEGSISPMETALTLLGAGGTALGSYYLVNRLLQEQREKALKKELHEAERNYLQKSYDLDVARSKAANITTGDTLAALPNLALLSVLLGGGALTYTFLNKHYPAPKTDTTDVVPAKARRRNIIFDETGASTASNESGNSEINEDDASIPNYSVGRVAYASADIGREFLLRRIMESEKQASDSQLDLIVKVASCGKLEELSESSDTVDQLFDKATEMVEGDSDIPEDRKGVAIIRVVTHPKVGPMLEPVLASEYNDMAGSQVCAASSMGDEEREMLLSIIENLVRGERMNDLTPHMEKLIPCGEVESVKESSLKGIDYDDAMAHFSKSLDAILVS
jgi:hypothetical protein